MGDFVGRPITPELLQGAMDAQAGMLRLVAKWKKQLPAAATVADGALGFWHQHHVFSTGPEVWETFFIFYFFPTLLPPHSLRPMW